MNDFGKLISESSKLINDLLTNHEDAIKRSFTSCDDDSFKISLSLKLTPVGHDVSVEAGISLVEAKIKDSIKKIISEQTALDFAGAK